MKHALIGIAILAFVYCLTTAPVSAQSMGKCKLIYYDLSGTGNSFQSSYVWFDDNGTYIDQDLFTAVWETYKGAITWIYDTSPYVMYAGKKSAGFMHRTNGTDVGVPPGVWYMKGTNKKNCAFAATASKGGQSESPLNPSN